MDAMDAFKPTLKKLSLGETLSASEATTAFELILNGQASESQIGGFLMALQQRGETVEEITAGAQIMRKHALSVKVPTHAIDTCGTGGDGGGTYNISTAVAIIVAACGAHVAKHGSKALSSKSGSSEVLEALGVRLDLKPAALETCIEEVGICFLFALNHHSAMRHVGPSRQALGFRTVFNLLGPLSNPASANRQLLGVYDQRWVEPLAHVLKKLCSERAWVVHGSDGLDELTTTGPSTVAELRKGVVTMFEVTPEEAGLPRAKSADLVGGTPAENAVAMQELFEGKETAYRDIVLLNAAAALCVSNKANNLREGVDMAALAIDDGGAKKTLAQLVKTSQRLGG